LVITFRWVAVAEHLSDFLATELYFRSWVSVVVPVVVALAVVLADRVLRILVTLVVLVLWVITLLAVAAVLAWLVLQQQDLTLVVMVALV